MMDRVRIVATARASRVTEEIGRSSTVRAAIATEIAVSATSTDRVASAPKDGWTGRSIRATSATRIAGATAGIARATAGIAAATEATASPTGRAATMRTTARFLRSLR